MPRMMNSHMFQKTWITYLSAFFYNACHFIFSVFMFHPRYWRHRIFFGGDDAFACAFHISYVIYIVLHFAASFVCSLCLQYENAYMRRLWMCASPNVLNNRCSLSVAYRFHSVVHSMLYSRTVRTSVVHSPALCIHRWFVQ